MLTELTVHNFALIDELVLQLKPGYTVLSGETGAGKSIIVDALNAALGERVSADVVRGGSEVSLTEAVFDADDSPAALEVLQDSGLADEDDATIILSREIASGRSRYRINRRVGTLGLLSEISRHLADIHGQHQHQSLLHEQNHLHFLDESGSTDHLELLERYRVAYEQFAAARRELRSLQMDEQERARRLDLLAYQTNEIEAAELQTDEEEQLYTRRLRLQAGEKLQDAIGQAVALISGTDDAALAAKDALHEAASRLETVATVDPELAASAAQLRQLAYQAEEAARTLDDYLQGVELDPSALEQVEARLDVISGLKRKYGSDVAEVLQFLDRAQAEAQRLADSSTRLEELDEHLQQLSRDAGALAERLSRSRSELALRLMREVAEELGQLGMAEARVEVQFDTQTDPDGLLMPDGASLHAGPDGVDRVRFLLGANPGEPVRPLAKVASGGELSRVMLALKSLSARGGTVQTIVFDEIDVGIGGVTAQRVGEKLMRLSCGAQVLCVTHLPQVASYADHHLVVEKSVADGRTRLIVRELDEDERVAEIARMYGDQQGQAALEHAREALSQAARLRTQARNQSDRANRANRANPSKVKQI
ncbi:MAG: DNA repair protein RecN [candidate division WS1 bacterium]|nr:DNA repair protein RecN [candidate division WS1 bacterium]